MKCCVPYCDSKTGGKHKISFHCFPNDLDLKKKWIVAIGRKDSKTGKYWIPYKNSSVCSLHFSPRQFNPTIGTLLKGSIPYIFLDYSLPEYGTLIDEKELALVNLPAEEYARIAQKKIKKREKTAKFRNKSSTITDAISITDSTANLKKTKKRSCLEINPCENELVEKRTNVSKTDMTIDESNEGNYLDCGLPNSNEFPLAGDNSFDTNKNNSSMDDNTKQTFSTVYSSQLSEQVNDEIVVYKETGFNKSKTDSLTKIVDLSLSVSKNNHTNNEAKQSFHRINDGNAPKDNIQNVNKATSSTESKDPEIQIVKIPLSLLQKSKSSKIQIPSGICLNEKSSLSSNTSTVSSTKIKKNVMKPVTHPNLKNITEKDKKLLNTLKAETGRNKMLTMELFQLQEEHESLLFSDESIDEKISLYNLEELETGIANADRKALFLHDQLCNLTQEKTMWSQSTLQFADKLEENLPACYNFLRRTNVINLPPPKQEREDSTSQIDEINID